MAGIYIHIPFCKQACSYCNFHFSTQLKRKDDVVKSIIREIEQRKSYLSNEKVESIYFGGGTPSLLSISELNRIFESIHQHFSLSHLKEVTLEANPDDLSQEKLVQLRDTPIDRLSIGIQSFHQEDLNFMGRAHTAIEGKESILMAQDSGFEKMTIDLIYGVPGSSTEKWKENLEQFFDLKIPHLSSYALTVEDRTAYANQIKKGQSTPPEEDELAEQYALLQEFIRSNNWNHYELSNYCQEGNEAIHNSSYWQGKSYLGIGPSAHSFNGYSRQWNVSNNQLYIKADFAADNYFQKEELTEKDRYHDALISRLRTKKGISVKMLEAEFSNDIQEHFIHSAEKLKEYFELNDHTYMIKEVYWLTSDEILRRLMLDD